MTVKCKSPAGLSLLSSSSVAPAAYLTPQFGCFTNPKYTYSHPKIPPGPISENWTTFHQLEPNSSLLLVHHKISNYCRANLLNMSLLSNLTPPTPHPQVKLNHLLSTPLSWPPSSLLDSYFPSFFHKAAIVYLKMPL